MHLGAWETRSKLGKLMNLYDMSKDSTGGKKKKVSASHWHTYWNSFSFPALKTLQCQHSRERSYLRSFGIWRNWWWWSTCKTVQTDTAVLIASLCDRTYLSFLTSLTQADRSCSDSFPRVFTRLFVCSLVLSVCRHQPSSSNGRLRGLNVD